MTSLINHKPLKRILQVFPALFLASYLSFAQCIDHNFAFSNREEVYYDVYYNWGFIWLQAGEVFFKVFDSTFEGKPAYFLDSYGSSLKKWDWFYKVRDTYQCYVDRNTLRPYFFTRKTSEGGYEVNNRLRFDYDNNRVFAATQNSKKPLSHDTLAFSSCAYDVLSMIYVARNINYQDFKVDEKIPITCIIDGQIYDLYIRYAGKETIETRDKITYRCIKFKPLLVEGTIFSGGEDMTVWVTDDNNRIPVLVEAKVLIGSIKAYLKTANGARHEITSIVETKNR